MQTVDELAKAITALPHSEQEALINKVAQLNLQKGLADLADKYRARLGRDGLIPQPIALRETFFTGLYRLWTVISHSVPSGLPVAILNYCLPYLLTLSRIWTGLS